MRRLARWLLSALTTLSLLACLGSAVLWVRSKWCEDYLWCYPTYRSALSISSQGQSLRFSVSQPWADLPLGIHAKTVGIGSADYLLFWFHSFEAEGGLLFREPGEHWIGSGTFSQPERSVSVIYEAGHPPPTPPPPATGRYAYVYVPSWTFVLLTAVLPALRMFARSRTRRVMNSGYCAACGYDLRATPDRCPECGKIPGTRI